MSISIVLGLQWGDEGKGKLVDAIAKNYDNVARFNGGANAGHTIYFNDEKLSTHLLPSGILCPDTMNIIGNGTVIEVEKLVSEINNVLLSFDFDILDRLLISNRAPIVFQFHKLIDAYKNIHLGTTNRGIGPAYETKINRNAVRIGDMLDYKTFKQKYYKLLGNYKIMYKDFATIQEYDELPELKNFKDVYIPLLKQCIINTSYYINMEYAKGNSILCEGANATMLDIDHGSYPYVTSSNTTVGGACTGLGISPQKINNVYGVIKAYCTRVGAGIMPTEQHNAIGDTLQLIGHEFGTTTGKKRRCGWLDAVAVRYAVMLNGITALCVTKLDCLSGFDKIKIGVSYHGYKKYDYPTELRDIDISYIEMDGWSEDLTNIANYEELPKNAKLFIAEIEKQCEAPVKWIGVGPKKYQLIFK